MIYLNNCQKVQVVQAQVVIVQIVNFLKNIVMLKLIRMDVGNDMHFKI